MIYYAHTRGGDKTDWQTVRAHLENTAELARILGSDSGTAPFAATAALLHDIGKYSQAFQRRLEGSTERVDHATAGAKETVRLFDRTPAQRILAGMLAYCIAGHHGGLMDYGSPVDCDTDGTLQGRLKRKLPEFEAYATEIDPGQLVLPERLPIRPLPGALGFSLAFFTRMIYSTLVDADFVETETFVNGKKPRGEYEDIPALAQRFAEFLRPFHQAESPINRRRTETLKACLARTDEPPGLFTLTLPTGGGKTFTSMGFALQHALRHGLKRIIYVIPYTSIIEQNAAEFKRSLGTNTVLEHHSNFDWSPGRRDGDSNAPVSGLNESYAKLRLAAENWDIPIVVTTSMQFFESLFASKKSRLRKLHNLAKSVILFDEAQMLPRDYLIPCLYAVAELVRNYGSSAVFCTATQPCIEPFLPKGMTTKELIPDPQEQFDFYRRVKVKRAGRLSDEALLERLGTQQQALCIVNTRKHARALFSGLAVDGRFHLSTLMCAAHRSQVIAEIRSRLKQRLACRVVSTQLLEAGVDLDFPVGFRALAGLESIIQSAGRVNREGKLSSADLFVFEPDSEHARFLPAYIRQSAAVARMVLEKYPDPVCIAAIQDYFGQLYDLHDPGAFDSQKVMACFEKGGTEPAFDFQTAAERFKLIDNDTTSVIIPYDEEAKRLIARLSSAEFPLSIIRALQPYTVNIFEPEYQALVAESAIDLYCERFAVLNQPSLYHPETGLLLPDTRGGKAIILEY